MKEEDKNMSRCCYQGKVQREPFYFLGIVTLKSVCNLSWSLEILELLMAFSLLCLS